MLKKRYLFLIIIICLFAISAVSAEQIDNNTNMMVNDYDSSLIVESVNEDTLGVSLCDDEIQESADAGTFTDLQLIINGMVSGSTIYLTKNYNYNSSIDTGNIRIDKQLTIDGNGYTINGNNKARAFSVSHNNVTLRNIEFTNCSASSGGAVYWYDADYGVLANCSFVNSSASSGGAVYWGYGADYGVLANCSFVNSSASSGGAVYWYDADYGVLANCSFVNSSASYSGAVYWYDADYGVLANCSFVNSSASDYGGAVYWYNGAEGVLANCSFVNSSASSGGAVYRWGANGVLANCSFVNSSAIDDGGAVYWRDGADGVLANCSFVNSSAIDDGGAVYWDYGADGVLANCSFVNSSASSGGAVYWDWGADGVLANCSFINSSASYSGGAVLWFGANGVVIESSFKYCRAGEYGGGIYFDADDCSLINPYFEGNSATEGSDWYSTQPLNVTNKTTISTVLSAFDVITTYAGSANLIATLKDIYNNALIVEQISISLNNKKYDLITDSNGQVSFAIPTNLSPKTYTATIYYAGNEIYESSNTTANVVVNKAGTIISAQDVSIAYKDPNGELVATVINEHGKPLVVNLNINFNGKDYAVRTDSNGQASIAIGTLTPGTYTATISYKGSSNYKASSTTARVTVTKSNTIISAPDINVAYKDSNGELVATIVSEHGKPLVVNLNFELNGKTYTAKTDANGQASILIGTLTPGTYAATISYKGSGNYKASSTTAKVTVTKASTVISAPDVSIAYKDPNGELVATIVSEHGKPLVVNLNININGKDYTVKTDSNGQAKIDVGTLTPGTYTATISYKGSSNYKASSTTAKVTVTKAATIISAPDVSVTYGDSNGKLVSTITNEHGKLLVVSLNVELNGKTYSAKTDSNGQMSVSTADLAPGTYTATISYKGSSNYKASSTTANIKVKK